MIFLIYFIGGIIVTVIAFIIFSNVLYIIQLKQTKEKSKIVEKYIKEHTYSQFKNDIKNKETNKIALLTKELLYSLGKQYKNIPEETIYKKIRQAFNNIIIMPDKKR